MNRSKPSTVVGGGEMNRATSSVESIASSDGASERRSSRSVTIDPVRTGSALRQSDVVVAADARAIAITASRSVTDCASRKGIFSMLEPSPDNRRRCRRVYHHLSRHGKVTCCAHYGYRLARDHNVEQRIEWRVEGWWTRIRIVVEWWWLTRVV